MEIRNIKVSDIPLCASIMVRNPIWQRYQVSEDSARARFAKGVENNATILIAEELGSVVGFIWYVHQGAFNRSGYIMLIGVDPDAQSHGIGYALMDAAEKEMFKSNADIFLLVSDFNVKAQQFYKRLGYQQVGVLENYVIPGVNELIFRKHINDQKA